MKRLIIGRDAGSIPTYGRKITDAGRQILTVGNTEYTIAIPTGANLVIFSATDHFFVGSASFTFPTSGVWSSQNIEMSPEVLTFDDETNLYLRTRSVVDLTLSFYA